MATDCPIIQSIQIYICNVLKKDLQPENKVILIADKTIHFAYLCQHNRWFKDILPQIDTNVIDLKVKAFVLGIIRKTDPHDDTKVLTILSENAEWFGAFHLSNTPLPPNLFDPPAPIVSPTINKKNQHWFLRALASIFNFFKALLCK
jgi:hypothetical protein